MRLDSDDDDEHEHELNSTFRIPSGKAQWAFQTAFRNFNVAPGGSDLLKRPTQTTYPEFVCNIGPIP